MKILISSAILTTLACMSQSSAWSQNSPAKPQIAKPVSSGVMTRDELRHCMSLQSRISQLALELDQSKPALAQQKDAIAEARKALEPLRTQVSLHRDRVLSADAAVKRHAELISSWNDEMKEIEDSTLTTAQRRKIVLEKEKIKLVATNNQLISQRNDEMKLHGDAINSFSEEAEKLDKLIIDWNGRNNKLANDSEKVIDLREDYAVDCSNRKYKEEDKDAIKAGQ